MYTYPIMDNCTPSYQLIPFCSNSEFFQSRSVEERSFITEFKLLGLPKSLEELNGLFQAGDRIVILWIGHENCFLSTYRFKRPNHEVFEFQWSVYKNGFTSILYICCAKTHLIQGAWTSLAILFQLPVRSFRRSMLKWSYSHNEVCPFPCEIIQQYILQHKKGSCGFCDMIFTPQQCQTMATSGNQTHLHFLYCKFQDGGKAFKDAYLSNEVLNAGPRQLDFTYSDIFDDTNLIACLQRLDELTLRDLHELSSELCRAVVSADLEHLRLIGVELEDEAAQILVHNIQQGLGPRGIYLDPCMFGSKEGFMDSCNALVSSSKDLETLEIANLPDLEAETALAAVWRRGNPKLTSFALTCCTVTNGFWNSLLSNISRQPRLRKLSFSQVQIEDSSATREELTAQLATVILAHQQIEQMDFCHTMFDRRLWEKLVIPALEHNEHRGRFAAIERVGLDHTRKTIAAAAMKKVSDRPSLLYVLLHRHSDVIVEFGRRPPVATH